MVDSAPYSSSCHPSAQCQVFSIAEETKAGAELSQRPVYLPGAHLWSMPESWMDLYKH